MGRRGAFLLFLLILDVSFGYSLLVIPPALRQLHNLLLPYPVWGWIWIAAAVNAAVGIFRKRDVVHYMIASMVKLAWAGVEADVWLIQHTPRGWVAVAIWVAFAMTVLIIAGWPEPRPFDVVMVEREQQ